MSEKYIYTIADLSKKHSQKEVLKNIWLSFYPGAKIGVLGKNGAGKSTLLRIMAGQDKNFEGEARLADGYSVGYLSQEPQLNPDKDVQGNVDEAVAHVRDILKRFDEVNNRLGEVTDPDEMEKLLG
ncbi:MAG TPA: ATP-binding cassette domain-containing protein, partial [Pirellulales bacterium]